MTNSTHPNNVIFVTNDQSAITGIDQYLSKLPSVLVAGVSWTPTGMKAVFQADIDATKALALAEAAVKEQRIKRKAARIAAAQLRLDLKAYILGNYGASSPTMLKVFGFPDPKPKGGVKTLATKTHAVAQAKATRAARGTGGKKQKAKIKGQVAPPAPGPAPSPTAPPVKTA